MVEFAFLRHADAGDPEAWTGDDAARPLSPKGEKQADRLGKFLAGVGFAPDAIITSPRLRAAKTAEIVAEQLGVPFSIDTRLGGSVDLATLETLLAESGDPARPVIVGHDPDLSDLVAELCGASAVPLRKGSFAMIEVTRPLTAGSGTLRWLIPPDLLKTSR